MSFFFSKAKNQPKPVSASKPTQANKSSKETLNRLSCKVCPLDKANNCTPKMQPDLADFTDIYILSEKPTEIEDEKGESHSSDANKFLRTIIGRIDAVSFDYCTRDYDHYAEHPAWVAMECCRSLVTKSIEQAKPKIIIGLGVAPLQWMLKSSDLIGLRGRIFAVKVGEHSCYFMSTYDPQFVIDNAFKKDDPLKSKLGHCLKFDIAKAKELALELDPPKIDTPQAIRAAIQAFNGHNPAQLVPLLKLISEARKAPEKAIDIETSHLKPYATGAKLLTCALSFGNTNFAFALDHPEAGWSMKDKVTILEALYNLLTDKTKIIAHNTPFEVEWLISYLDKEVVVHDNWECTMMQSHFIDERRGKRGGNDDQFQPNPYQALDFLVKQYFGLAYKGLFKLDRKNMAQADLGETLTYNGADTKYTLRLYKVQKAILKQLGLYDAYREAAARQPTVALMQSIGIDVDPVENKRLEAKLGKEIAVIETRINETPEVKKYIVDRKSFNPASQPDVIKVFKEYIKVGKVLLNEEGKETVDKNTLSKIKHPLAKDIEEYRNRSKLKSTYVDPFVFGKGEFIWPDAKIHPACNTTFAETGRTSSDEPNQQNWPNRKDNWVRKQLVAPKGHILVAFDFGQLEACTAAMCTKDKVLIKALWEDYDIHMEWTQKTAKIYPQFLERFGDPNDPLALKKARSVIKNKLVFPVIFGATNASVAGYLGIPIDPVDKLMAEFWKTFHGLYRWQKDIMHDYYNHGFVSSPTGRRRHYPLSKNQAVNYPIQSVACDIVCRAMVTLSKASMDGKGYLHPIMNIHDDLTFAIPDKPQILEETIETIYRTMIDPGYDFINVPLSVNCSIGENWLDMKDVGKFWSHRDL